MRHPLSIAALSVLLWLACAPGARAIDREALKYDQLIANLRGREPQTARYPLYCRKLSGMSPLQQSRRITWIDGQYQRWTDYRVRWSVASLRKAPRKVDFSKRYYGLEPGECAWEDRPLSQAEPEKVCYVTGVYYLQGFVPPFVPHRSSGWSEGDYLEIYQFSMSMQPDNQVWKIPAHTRLQPLTCLDIDFGKKEWVEF